jgi:hypothetical protein
VTGGARVSGNNAATYFTTDLDAFGGNSGSAVFHADTLEVEGILVRGEPEEFVSRGNCFVTRVCRAGECGGEDVTRITELSFLVPEDPGPTTFIVRFGRCGELAELGTTSDTRWPLSGLEPGVEYCWQVESVNRCGRGLGPIWRFTTAGETSARPFRRGDLLGTGRPTISDAVSILSYLFTEGSAPVCLDAADTDDTGTLDLTDGIFLLAWLFRGGEVPPSPQGDCGPDPSPDPLACAESPGCP